MGLVHSRRDTAFKPIQLGLLSNFHVAQIISVPGDRGLHHTLGTAYTNPIVNSPWVP